MLDFELMFKRQIELDGMIKCCRERDLIDMHMSFRAEVIEFNETLGIENSHKTWKTKKFTRTEQLNEFVDMLFFVSQFCVSKVEIDEEFKTGVKESWLERSGKKSIFEKDSVKKLCMILLDSTLHQDFEQVIIILSCIAGVMNFTDEEIMEAHKNKYDYNLKRIGGEWN